MSISFGDPRLPSRFWAKVHPEPNSGCWLWSGSVAPRGYGQVWMDGSVRRCTRIIAALKYGVLGDGQDVCHSCDNPYCCNPDHLWIGTRSDNMRDCYSKGRQPPTRRKKTHCKRGHPRAPDNLHGSNCLECKRYRQRNEYTQKEAR